MMKLLSAVPIRYAPWQHHWRVRATWNNVRKRWEARIRPGLVNALPATVSLPREDFPRWTLERYEALGEDAPDRADIPLTDAPLIPLSSLRALGTDVIGAGAPEAVPEYFRLLGVKDGRQLDLDSDILSQLAPADGTGARLLRACDIVLHVDRPASATEWSFGAGVGGTVAQFAVTIVQKPNARRGGYVTITPRWIEPQARNDLLAGNVADSPTDEYLLATVYLLSPQGLTGEEIKPDGTWRPFVRHSFFWNVRHAVSAPQELARQDLSIQTNLAGGVGDAVNNFILSQVNDANSAAAQFLSKVRVQSMLWTV